MSTTSIVATALLAALFLFASSVKLLRVDRSLQVRDHLGRTPAQWNAIGLLELTGVVGLLVGLGHQPIATAAAIGLGLVGAGAFVSHMQVRDGIAEWGPAVLGVVLAAAALVSYATT